MPYKVAPGPRCSNLAYHLDYRYCRDQGNQSSFVVCSPKGDRCLAHCNEQSEGILLFALPLTLSFINLNYSGTIVCAVATFAAIQEGHLIRTGAGKNAP